MKSGYRRNGCADLRARNDSLLCCGSGQRGTEELPERREEIASLADKHGTVFVFDPRGVGAVKNRVIPIPGRVDAYNDIYGTEFKLAYDALQLKSSLLGMRGVRRASICGVVPL